MFDVSGRFEAKGGAVGGWVSSGNIFPVALIRNICYKWGTNGRVSRYEI